MVVLKLKIVFTLKIQIAAAAADVLIVGKIHRDGNSSATTKCIDTLSSVDALSLVIGE